MKQIFKRLISSQKWRTTQLTHALNSTTSLLFTMLLVKNGLSEKNVILAFAVIYALALIPLYFENYMQITKNALYVSSGAVIVTFLYKQSLVIYPLTIFAASMQVSRDMMFSEVISVYSYLSRKMTVDVKKIIAVAMTFSTILVCAANPIIGTALAISPTLYFLCVGLAGLYIAHNLIPRDHDYSYNSTHIKSFVTKDFKYFCFYSFAVVTCRYFIRFFTLPILILTMSNKMGISNYSFAALGLIAGLVGVTSFIGSKPKQENDGRGDLYKAMFLTLLASLNIALINMYAKTLPTLALAILVIGSYFALEYISKIFAVHQAAELRDFAEKERSRDYVYATFTKYRVFGGFVGFMVAFLLYSKVTCSMSVFIVCSSLVIALLASTRQVALNKKIK